MNQKQEFDRGIASADPDIPVILSSANRAAEANLARAAQLKT